MHMDTFDLSSSAFQNNGQMPSKYTCDGEGISPPLSVEHIPSGAKSLSLTVEDPDAPGGTWDHWIRWNIPVSAAMIPEHTEPEGVAGRGSGGNLTYQGPCPPGGTHRYIFTVYALDSILDLPEGSSKEELKRAMQGHVLGKTQLIGLYARK